MYLIIKPGSFQIKLSTIFSEIENSSADNIKDFMNEINTLKMIDKHPNIIRLIGHSLLQEAPFLMIMEYIPSGDLKEYLRDIRDEWAIKTANGGFL